LRLDLVIALGPLVIQSLEIGTEEVAYRRPRRPRVLSGCQERKGPLGDHLRLREVRGLR
jgi:hypothetical protein